MSENIIEVTEDNFQEVKKRDLVLDCWAEWCGPCKMISPIVEELADEYEGEVAFGKLDCDENKNIVMEYGIMAIPTLLFFKNGELVDKVVGVVPKEDIQRTVEEHY